MKSKIQNLFTATNRAQWRAWLAEHHESEQEIWLVYFKKHTGKAAVTYADSVEEAICYGWIDGLKKSIDDERYSHRFSPRRTKSRWTPVNIERARRMIEQELMAPAGLAAFENRQEYEDSFNRLRQAEHLPVPEDINKALESRPRAMKNFKALAQGYQKQYLLWLTTAKKPETRARRLEKALTMLEKNQKPGML